MRSFGTDLTVFGSDFDRAKVEAMRVAAEGDDFPVPPFHTEPERGVATYGDALLRAHSDLDANWVPIGRGSGIVGTIDAPGAPGLSTRVVGVVSTQAAGAKLTVEVGHLVETNSARTFADGMAVRVPVQAAFDIYATGADRILTVSAVEITAAIRRYFECTHNLDEGAGTAPLAALLQERAWMAERKVVVVLTGGNIDTAWFRTILASGVPAARAGHATRPPDAVALQNPTGGRYMSPQIEATPARNSVGAPPKGLGEQ